MPAKRLPWFRFWVGATAHGKVRLLDDGTFRTWVELLDAAAQQAHRGRFASATEAAAIVRRPVKHVRLLIGATLIDETPDGLTMHDWDEWQRWRKEDANDDESPTDRPPNDSPTSTESHTNVEVPLREKEIQREKEIETTDVTPPSADADTPQGAAPLAATEKKHRPKKATADEIEKLVAEFAPEFGGGEPAVRSEIARALNHTSSAKWIDQTRGLRDWLRRDVEQYEFGLTKPTPLHPPGRNGELSYDERMRRGIVHI